jgi:osmotically inducible lipoprotein OsmB
MRALLAALMLVSLAGCGYSRGERAVSGGLLGAGAGAGVSALTGGGIGTGALIGGGLGAAGGALTAPNRRGYYGSGYGGGYRSGYRRGYY